MTTESVLQHHLECFGAGDLNGIISDYTEESVLFTPTGVLRGIRAFGTDSFVVRSGKIEAQSLAAKIVPRKG